MAAEVKITPFLSRRPAMADTLWLDPRNLLALTNTMIRGSSKPTLLELHSGQEQSAYPAQIKPILLSEAVTQDTQLHAQLPHIPPYMALSSRPILTEK